jgi:DNA-binding NtrC family response regulator
VTAILTAADHRSFPRTSRRRERRQALGTLLDALVERLVHRVDRRHDPAAMRRVFEETLRRIVPARAVRLREIGGYWPTAGQRSSDQRTPRAGHAPQENAVIGRGRSGTSLLPRDDSIALEVPGSEPGVRAVLETTFDSNRRPGPWDLQLLELAGSVAALVLEIERSRALLVRAPLTDESRQKSDGAAPLIGSTPAMQVLRSTIERVAGTDFTVLLEGESGVGKELVAHQIHDLSRRRHGPFVALNCAALVETLLEAELFGIEERTATGVRGRLGKFEHAEGGTLFLDEVSDLSLSAQAKLLRAIQDLSVERVGGRGSRRIDVRIIAATNRALSGLVDRGLFRPDLFYRLSGVDVRVPTLRERRADTLELANYFLDRHRPARVMRLSAAAAGALVTYNWPGNVRELERLIERLVTLASGDLIELDDLPSAVRGDYASALGPSLQRNETMRAWGSRYARLMVERCHGNKRAASRILRISYHTLQAYLRYPIHDPPEAKREPVDPVGSGAPDAGGTPPLGPSAPSPP